MRTTLNLNDLTNKLTTFKVESKDSEICEFEIKNDNNKNLNNKVPMTISEYKSDVNDDKSKVLNLEKDLKKIYFLRDCIDGKFLKLY